MTIYILGINAFHADASAVLLKNGVVTQAIAEERLNRIKHYAGFPKLAIRKILSTENISINDINHIAIARNPWSNLSKKINFSTKNIHRMYQLAHQRLENRKKIRDIPSLIAQCCEIEKKQLRARIHTIEHHLCHAASSYFCSPFKEAVCFTADGFGDFVSTSISHAHEQSIDFIQKIFFPHSLGIFYSALCQHIGYNRYGDEGKVMGLAPYGKPIYKEKLLDVIHNTPNGCFELNLDYFIHHTEGVDYSMDAQGIPTVSTLFSKKLLSLLGPARQEGEPLEQKHMDLAASLQKRFEEVYFHILKHAYNTTQQKNLCIAGGVTLNSVANGQISEHTGFESICAHPAAGDDGTAVGAALYVHNAVLKQTRSPSLQHAFLGNFYTSTEIDAALERHALTPTKPLSNPLLCEKTAELLRDGKIVGWFQGKMEWGPRALGARSILAHPGFPNMKDILNSRIKHRESFRPFAPAVLEEKLSHYFDSSHPSPFMMMVYKTKPEKQALLTAVDHIDHTGRVQTVSKEEAPLFYALIEAFEKLTGTAVLLNTSFNENEPVVCSPDEAIGCFLRTHMDALAIGPYLLIK
jgi:carbamoyltransferase